MKFKGCSFSKTSQYDDGDYNIYLMTSKLEKNIYFQNYESKDIKKSK
jgi:hypothetical protein